mgnify:CR=1 FL=1|jgi:predicted GIY-YIG superfamily endonuclease|tara:strand:- start:80 stop:262 length:183 start_codon:yes stop_codon:yes gene_type:complete
MNLYVIHYIDGYDQKFFEDVTDDFDKWLKEHNSSKEEDFQDDADDFEVTEVKVFLYNKEN